MESSDERSPRVVLDYFDMYGRDVGLFEIRTTRPKYSTRRTRVESDPLLEVANYLNFNRIVRNDRTVRHNQTVRSDRTV